MRFLSATLRVLAVVTGACGIGQTVPITSIAGQPFSADEVIIENVKPNVHNVIPMKRIHIYRDSAGRTREDVSIPPDPTANPFVVIRDPGAGVDYSLDTEKKIARRFVYPPATPTAPVPGVMMHSQNGKFTVVSSESLGTAVIEGLVAEGKRTATRTNSDFAIHGCDEDSVSESWYSLDLRVILLMKNSDCTGEHTTRLEHIDRREPDPRLFQVPSDYTIVDR
jgi:hypothetical protein